MFRVILWIFAFYTTWLYFTDLQERHSYVVELLKKIDIIFVNETNFQKKILFRELKIFLEKEEINILNQIDKTKFNF